MKVVYFTLQGEQIVNVMNLTDMSDDFVKRLIKTFVDLGWIVCEVMTVGSFEMTTENSVKIEYNLTEFDGNVETYEFEEDSFVHLLTDEEPEQRKVMGYRGMSNVSQA